MNAKLNAEDFASDLAVTIDNAANEFVDAWWGRGSSPTEPWSPTEDELSEAPLDHFLAHATGRVEGAVLHYTAQTTEGPVTMTITVSLSD